MLTFGTSLYSVSIKYGINLIKIQGIIWTRVLLFLNAHFLGKNRYTGCPKIEI